LVNRKKINIKFLNLVNNQCGEKMRPIRYPSSLALKLGEDQRRMVEKLAEQEKTSLGEAARELLDLGIKARGIE
jgi:hypothetical protein